MKWEVWLYDRVIAETLTFSVAEELYDIMKRKHPTTWCAIREIGTEEFIIQCNE